MLPESKDEFPKCIYLDQNKWIDLAKAYYGRKDGKPFKEALESLRSTVEAGTVIVPISATHVMETAVPRNQERRNRFAKFMVDFSNNLSIVPHTSILTSEIKNSIFRVLGRIPQISIRAQIIQKGLWFALGVQPIISGIHENNKKILLESILNSRAFSIEFLINACDKKLAQKEVLKELENIRKYVLELDIDMHRRFEFANLFTKGPTSQKFKDVLQSLNITLGDFMKNFKDPNQFLSFFQSIYTMDAYVTLIVARDREKHRKIQLNDTRDLGFLCTALPYCNAIITEKFWGHLIKSTGLSERYKTQVETNIAKLPNLLKNLGCL